MTEFSRFQSLRVSRLSRQFLGTTKRVSPGCDGQIRERVNACTTNDTYHNIPYHRKSSPSILKKGFLEKLNIKKGKRGTWKFMKFDQQSFLPYIHSIFVQPSKEIIPSRSRVHIVTGGRVLAGSRTRVRSTSGIMCVWTKGHVIGLKARYNALVMFYGTVPFREVACIKFCHSQHNMLKPHVPRLSLFQLPKLTPHYRAMSVFSAKRLENKTVLLTGASGGIGEVCYIQRPNLLD